MHRRFLIPMLLALVLALVFPTASLAAAPWDGTPVSPVLEPPWPVPPESSDGTFGRQGTSGGNIANIPYASVGPLLAQFQREAAGAGIAPRMQYFVIGQSAGGRDLYGVVINALDTPEQRRDFANWQQVHDLALTDPMAAKALLASFGDEVKVPIFIEASIHGNEYEGVDAAMQVIRDLTTTPYGTNAAVDKLLDHAIIVVNPVANPDGRVQGTRSNGAGVDMNRDGFVQSQPEIRNSWRLMFDWLPVGGLGLHGYYSPTLIDGLTIPHNPGIEYDIFAHWNQLRTERNKADFAAAARQIQRPVNDWTSAGSSLSQYTIAAAPTGATQSDNVVTITTTATPSQIAVGDKVSVVGVADSRYNGVFTVTARSGSTLKYVHPSYSGLPASGGGTAVANGPSPTRGPAFAQGWDDWGPFYGQTIMATVAVDSSTVEVPSTSRVEGKTCAYLAIYSSADFWVDNRQAMLSDQLERFRRGVHDEPWNPNAIESDPVLVDRGFTDYWHNWMYDYPKAYVIPFGDGQRSDIEANRLARFLLDNKVQVTRATEDFTWDGVTYQAGSYVVWMNQAMRGLAREALGRNVDIVAKITTLYASPAAWSHGLVWGADVVEVPRGDASFTPPTTIVTDTNELRGGIRDGLGAPADWYSLTLKSVREFRLLMEVLKDGVRGEIAEVPFASTTGGRMPAGSLVFPADDDTAAALDAFGKKAGVWIERNVGSDRPAATRVAEAPRVAVLRNTYTPPPYVPFGVVSRIFGPENVGYVTTGGSGPNSLSTAPTDPLLGYDFIWNEQGSWPTDTTARARLNAFFQRGGGYMGDNYQAANYTFLTASGLVTGSITQSSTTSANTYGGIHRWVNVAGETSPITGAYPAEDYGFVPARLWWFTAVPNGAIVDARYHPSMTATGTGSGWISGMWLNRSATPGVNNGILIARGPTTVGSRYVIHSSDLTTRFDPERAWLMIGQAALWTNLTDEVTLDEGPATQTVQYSDAIEPLVVGAHDADTAGSALQATATGLPDGATLTRVSDNGSTVPGAASWKISGNVTAPAGTYDVTVTVGDAVRVTGSTSLTIVVKQEDAALLYNGSAAIPVGTRPTLGAQFWDSAAAGFPGSNPEPAGAIGDITRAWVRFAVSNLSSPVGTAIAPVADTGTPGDGIGSASALFTSSSSSEAVWTVTSTVVASGGTSSLYYAAPADTTGVVVFYQDTGQFATGGGTIPDGARKANFGFVARYSKNGKPQAQVVYVFRGTYHGVDATFQIKSNALTGLAFSGKTYPITATLEGKATITIVDGNNTVLFSAGNWRFTASVTDTNVNPGTGSDRFAITIWDADNQLYKSVPSTLLSGGNITVKNPK